MGTPEFTWTALLPVEREVDPQLYDDLITHWNKALVQASLTGGGSLLASAPALFRRVPAPASWREPTMGPSWPACAPQLLPLFVETERCAFLPGMWLEEVLRSSLVAGPLFDPPCAAWWRSWRFLRESATAVEAILPLYTTFGAKYGGEDGMRL
ncbi:hypothetical protein F1559_001891 [Cyanidiococcus yangmingshanensis]|uniref:Uncharacterized protein n=1 Tax=Cyanidiococcus yangmingshanensis TaxID=2690220 RepID=A0A7J7IIB4_9RHOD|nr:hypothetical protein F1559_001891 [Cyanidiococcus yangmingshanensis]